MLRRLQVSTRRKLAVALVVAVGVAFPTSLSAAAPSVTSAPVIALCSSGYVSASLPWGHKCLRAGEFCKVGNRAYIRFGFYCPAGGHLRRR
jgi:hypothetical protein